MKKNKALALLVALLALGWSNLALGQYDDVYYDPDKDGGYYETSSDNNSSESNNNNDNNSSGYNDDEYDYDDDEYEYDNDNSDYGYSSRIRRFTVPIVASITTTPFMWTQPTTTPSTATTHSGRPA